MATRLGLAWMTIHGSTATDLEMAGGAKGMMMAVAGSAKFFLMLERYSHALLKKPV
ncbi:hypothetical protein [Roseobacter weihaiensis]|uniref:hypothetical protein n=1 Tax=Roseobacter weihaiensis TaxID=2763262 RepID=UPI001D0A3121|nr:hypothetical protein [Roseobacter sp. H9]